MVDSEEGSKPITRGWMEKLTIFMIVATVVYIVILAFFGFKIANESFCGRNTYTGISGAMLTNTSILLDSGQDYVLQEFEVLEDNNVFFHFCYEIVVNADSGLEVFVIDQDNKTLTKDFIVSGRENYCTEIVGVSKQNFLGLRCEECNATNNIRILQDIIGVDTKRISYDGTTKTVEVTNPVAFQLFGRQSCVALMFYFSKWYFVILGLVIFFGVIFFNYEIFKEDVLDVAAKHMDEDEKGENR